MTLTNNLTRYGFRIRVRNGIIVERLLILGKDIEDAQAKLSQMYPHSEILSSWQEGQAGTPGNAAAKATFEEVADLINRQSGLV